MVPIQEARNGVLCRTRKLSMRSCYWSQRLVERRYDHNPLTGNLSDCDLNCSTLAEECVCICVFNITYGVKCSISRTHSYVKSKFGLRVL